MDAPFLAADLKKADPDRYLLSLFAPRAVRPELWALFSFNAELVKTRSMVSNTQLGLIRLQWWRDEINKIYDGGDGGQIPQLSTLAPLIHRGDLPHEWFEALLYAREFDLEDVAPASAEGLKNYCDFTTTPLNQLMLKIVKEEALIDEIRQISTNFGLCETMRRVPLLLSQRRNLLP
ncbi:MAG: phytoene/squalene synthetase, partial [Micavibrio aeruginosavorus]